MLRYALLVLWAWAQAARASSKEAAVKLPLVYVSVPIRNKAHSLPYFLGALERLEYPKDRIALDMVLDHCIDESQAIVEKWLARVQDQYLQLKYKATTQPPAYANAANDLDWADDRMNHLISLKMAAMRSAETMGADYVFFLDADAILMDQNIVKYLVSLKLPIVAPMLNTTDSYSNFWAGMDKDGYYQRTDQYSAIRNRTWEGVFQVPLVHSAVLVDLRAKNADNLTFDCTTIPSAPRDDIIVFALSARASNVPMYVVNTGFFGYLPIPRDGAAGDTLQEEVHHFREVVTSRDAMQCPDLIPEPFSYDAVSTTKVGFDEIYVINLPRQPVRAEKIKRAMQIHNVGHRLFPASDGRLLNATYLNALGVRMLEGYRDPYYDRPLKMGEIGCFLSHYFIWEDMIRHNYSRALILEDDAYFMPTFSQDTVVALSEADRLVPDWELVFLGRKSLNWSAEEDVEGASHLVWPAYSYWGVAYGLTLSGARKLLAPKPLEKMVALDEYIPIMYNKNDNTQWLDAFHPRDLVALAVTPRLVYPQFYTGDPGYYSDTEYSVIIDPTELAPPAPTTESIEAVIQGREVGDDEL